MSVDSNSFIFELEESLFFEKGQEVEEIRGISIEPEITIESLDNYISIRGAIELQGEYQKVNVDEEEGEVLDFDQIQAKRYVESIREVNGLYLFTHKFPVDISVPPHRVKNLEDVTVQIETFDYDLLGPDSLKIAAVVEINGILQDEVYRPAEENLEEEEQEQVGDTFSFEIEHPEEKLTRNEQTTSEEQTVSEEQTEDDPDRWKIKSQPLSEYFQSLSEAEVSEEEEQLEEELEIVEDIVSTEETEEESDWDTTDESEIIDYIEDTIYQDTPRDEEITESKEPEEKEERTENESILSEIFREADQNHYVRMRLCIVQENDTIDTIAERFAISPLQLIKHNQLDADYEVNEGQLLYIPANQ
ncbi:stage VI sporulation protein D [Oceanobacillus sojae]|uniref:stage VI sporulation protein D n=1 Tax=Oceanobacillus sojae TaxID=582851 RepID=UPI0021A69D56|nr:stage VI sporulation protein D [Oceanobacillus sojae]MCT1903380.1 stage VI sporulation protein D [Oceanobacillus sojae]